MNSFKAGSAEYKGKKYALLYNRQNNSIWLDYIFHGTWQESLDWAESLNSELIVVPKHKYKIVWHDDGRWMLPEQRFADLSPDIECLYHHTKFKMKHIESGYYWAKDSRDTQISKPVAYDLYDTGQVSFSVLVDDICNVLALKKGYVEEDHCD